MKRILGILAIVLGVVLIDQAAKCALLYLITGGVPLSGPAFGLVPYPYLMAHVTGFFNFVFTWNPGTSFSLFRNLGEAAPLVIITLTGVIIGALGYTLFARAKALYEKWALSLIVGGALGNLIDRIRFGAVIDFLDFHVGGWHWPAFNAADIAITFGVIIYIAAWVFKKKEK
ncbi:MAG: signal peptidase II [Rickettsiales bacterium]|jgi:signal peptidase II|nr:signal peptidase II [Rickettsiales bacterium]